MWIYTSVVHSPWRSACFWSKLSAAHKFSVIKVFSHVLLGFTAHLHTSFCLWVYREDPLLFHSLFYLTCKNYFQKALLVIVIPQCKIYQGKCNNYFQTLLRDYRLVLLSPWCHPGASTHYEINNLQTRFVFPGFCADYFLLVYLSFVLWLGDACVTCFIGCHCAIQFHQSCLTLWLFGDCCNYTLTSRIRRARSHE